MSILYNLSIRNKLIGITLFVTILALGIGFTLVIVSNIKSFKEDMKNNTIVTAQVIGEYCVSPLVFEDNAGAEQILAKLSDVPSITKATVYDTDGELFVSFASSKKPAAQSPIVRERSSEFVDNYLHVYEPIIYKDEYYGTIYLQSSTQLLATKIRDYLQYMTLLLVGLTIVSVFLAIRLQRIISKPILNLAGVARKIAEEKNYSIRVQKLGSDETGLLYDGFNNMLDQVQSREIERDRAEDALRLSEEKFRTLTTNIPGAIYRCANDPDWTVDFISNVIEQISGYKATDFIKNRVRSYASIILRDDTNMVNETVHQAISKREPYLIEYRICKSDGQIRWVYEKGQGVFSEDGDLLWLDGAIFDITERKVAEEELAKHRDHLEDLVESRTIEITKANKQLQEEVTERKKAEGELRDSEEKFRKITASALDAIIMMDDNGNISYWNEAAEEIFGNSAQEALGKEMHTFIAPQKYFGAYEKGVRTFKATGQGPVVGKTLELTALRGDGTEFPIELSVSAVKIKGRWHSIGILRDITDRKEAEELIATRLRYEEGLAACSRTLLTGTETKEDLSEALDHLLNAANASRVYLFENFMDEADGLCMRRTHEISAKGIKSQLSKTRPHHTPYKQGFERWRKLLSKGEPINGKVETFPRAERKILEPQKTLSMLILPITVNEEWYGFIGFDDVKKKREWSGEDIRSLRTASEMIGIYIETKIFEEALRVSEERFRSLVENANDIIYSVTPKGEITYISPKATDITGYDVSILIGKNIFTLLHPDDKQPSIEWFQSGLQKKERKSSLEFRLIHKDKSIRWMVTQSSLIHKEEGDIMEIIGVAHDFTEVKTILNDLEMANLHLRETQAQLVQSAKMASLGKLVAGIAHEINTPIGAVNSMQDTLFRALEKLKDTIGTLYSKEQKKVSDIKTNLKVVDESKKVINSGTERVINIVKRLRSFARLDEAELKTVDIHEGLEDTLTLIHHDIKHNIQVKKNYGDIPPIACYPGRLNQVFLNILVNAKQAIKGKGIIDINTYTKQKKVFIEIKDNGEGIDNEHLKKVFDPGFTTKGVGVGTGLGLSICYQIMQDHRGEILVESEVDKGTTFTVVLPMDLDNKINQGSDRLNV
jgi:PAS domain S-box-containing protein